MSWIEALILGMLQGVTEFFPVSSSAHLKLGRMVMGVQEDIPFDLACHLGTLIAVLYFFRRDIFQILFYDRMKLFWLFLATLPLVPFYFLLKPLREALSETHFLGFCLMGTALLLFLGQRVRFKAQNSKSKEVLFIGAMQGLALIPGISRSAATIATAQALGWEAKEAVRFSFLLSIPTVIGGNFLVAIKGAHEIGTISFSSCLIGFLSSCSIGLVMIGYALRLLEKKGLKPFAWYCLVMGIALSTLLLWPK